MIPVLYIHGAKASARSFSYIQAHLPSHDSMSVSYDADDGLSVNIERIAKLCSGAFDGRSFDIVAHSLGGLKAVALHQETDLPIRRIYTMSAPFGGSSAANMLSWVFPFSRLYADISTGSTAIAKLGSSPITIPMRAAVTYGGSIPLLIERNDGVVSVSSQRRLRAPDYVEYNLNHFEVLLSPEVVQDIKHFLH